MTWAVARRSWPCSTKPWSARRKRSATPKCGQHGLFGVFQEEESNGTDDKLPNIPDWDEHTRLADEKEILGFFITGHPLEKYRDKLEDLRALSVRRPSAP